MTTLNIEPALRPCVVAGKNKCLFHRWEQLSEIIPPSPMIGGHSGGCISHVCGIVENEDGSITRVHPNEIRFLDNIFKNYCFAEYTEEE